MTQHTSQLDRRYYQMRWVGVVAHGLAVFVVAFAVVLVLGSKHDNGNVPPFVWLCSTVLPAAIIMWSEFVVRKTGLQEREDGLVYHHNFGHELMRWRDIQRFEHRQIGNQDRVYALLTSDRRKLLFAVLEGQRVRWDGGETRSITGVLNERLLIHQRAEDADPVPPSGRR